MTSNRKARLLRFSAWKQMKSKTPRKNEIKIFFMKDKNLNLNYNRPLRAKLPSICQKRESCTRQLQFGYTCESTEPQCV
jgi:hypothetical protein